MKIEILNEKEIKAAMKRLGDDLPKALADGLNRTMRGIKEAEIEGMKSSIDRPTRFTLDSLRTFKAHPRHLDAGMFIPDIAANYLKNTIDGGTLEKTIVPFAIRLNQSGNIPGKIGGWAGMAKGRGKNVFTSKIKKGRAKGKTGLFRKQGESVALLALRDTNAKREKRFDYYGIAEKEAAKRLQSDVVAAIDDALRSR
jgi:hypothetical protein